MIFVFVFSLTGPSALRSAAVIFPPAARIASSRLAIVADGVTNFFTTAAVSGTISFCIRNAN